MNLIINLIIGALFSIGLTISGMVNPNKVIGFLDIFRDWDPSLIFVMGGGVGLNIILFKFILKRKNPIFESEFSLPTNKIIDWKLFLGSALFGIGWGIGGICPGPALANLFLFDTRIIAFIISMFVGILLFRKVSKFL